MGKVWLFGAAIDAGFVWLAVIGVANSAISLFYYIRVVVFMWIKEEVMGSPIQVGPAMATALAIALFRFRLLRSLPSAPVRQRPGRGRYPRFVSFCGHSQIGGTEFDLAAPERDGG